MKNLFSNSSMPPGLAIFSVKKCQEGLADI
jgi:hypothetical protein